MHIIINDAQGDVILDCDGRGPAETGYNQGFWCLTLRPGYDVFTLNDCAYAYQSTEQMGAGCDNERRSRSGEECPL